MFKEVFILLTKIIMVVLVSIISVFACYLYVLPSIMNELKKFHPDAIPHAAAIGYLPLELAMAGGAFFSGLLCHRYLGTNTKMCAIIRWSISIFSGAVIAALIAYISFFAMLNTMGS